MSWIHNAAFPGITESAHSSARLMNKTGIAVEFAEEVLFAQFTGSEKPGPTHAGRIAAPP